MNLLLLDLLLKMSFLVSLYIKYCSMTANGLFIIICLRVQPEITRSIERI